VEQAPWPHIYRVTLRGIEGQTRIETVLSWLGDHKAVAMVVQAHSSGWVGLRRTWSVYAVDVDDLGLAPRNKDGTVGIPKGCWDDRNEF
jgi:hypothetical protein